MMFNQVALVAAVISEAKNKAFKSILSRLIDTKHAMRRVFFLSPLVARYKHVMKAMNKQGDRQW